MSIYSNGAYSSVLHYMRWNETHIHSFSHLVYTMLRGVLVCVLRYPQTHLRISDPRISESSPDPEGVRLRYLV